MPAEPATSDQSIIGGVLETGWPAVGALTIWGSEFCTGTLIASNWVLTAAHCLAGDAQFQPTPAQTKFFIGTNVPNQTGTFYQVGAFYIHPSFTGNMPDPNDIALVYLSDTVAGTTPIAYNTAALDNSYVNDDVTYVGFGNSDAYQGNANGIKRSAILPIIAVYQGYYNTESTSTTGVCAGDSGGPGLLQFTGTWRVIGVNSTVASASNEPCLNGQSTQTRVDKHSVWIQNLVAGLQPNCNTNANLCNCAEACLANGTCNNGLCPTLDCEGLLDCMNPCADQACLQACYDSASPGAQAQYDALATCMSDHCANAADQNQCLIDNCANEYLACLPPSNCDITGGDCDPGTACWPSLGNATDCFGSLEKAPGAACNAAATDSLECDDGMICIDEGAGAKCYAFCLTNPDCAADEECYAPIFQGVANIGVCVCLDTDNDGYCDVDDCGPTNAAVNPGATEVCGDGIDNNCDGTVDEGCEPCTDADGDGACTPADCNDADSTVNPAATEVCGDGIDNNCNGQIDEGCPVCVAAEICGDGLDNDCNGLVDDGCPCVDADGDGYCSDVDCDDHNSGVNPDQVEKCGDGLDNDCDGIVDNNCATCVDADGDGYCAAVDCNDSIKEVRPGQVEFCDGIDNNCDGVIDEGCPTAPGKHGCSSSGGPGAPFSLLMVGLGFALLLRRRRR